MDHSCMKQLVNPYRECRKQAATYNRALSSMQMPMDSSSNLFRQGISKSWSKMNSE